MDRTRFEFLKGVASHFRENPQATYYQGVSRATCFSLLALYFSPPGEILDPTAPDFLAQATEKINSTEESFNQNQAPPQTEPVSPQMESTVQAWQEETSQGKPSPQIEKAGRLLDGKLKDFSLEAWRKAKPDLAPKVSQFLGKGKLFGRMATVGKVLGGIGFALAAVGVSAAIIQRAVKYLGGILYGLYMLFSALGIGALIGATVGGVVGGLAGGVAGAIFGAKLGAAIGAAVGGPVGAAIGGVLGGITGFVVGALGGAIVGVFVGGGLGYAIEHWLWRPAQNLWSAGGNFLGATGNFLGTLWTGFWTGVGNLASAAVSWAGGAAITTANFFTGLGAQLSTLSLAPVATVPLLGTIGLGVGFTLWLGTDIVGTSFMRPPAPFGPPVSQYITVQKTVSPKTTFNNNELPVTITYALTVSAKDKPLVNVRIKDQTVVTKEGSPPSVPPRSWTVARIVKGSPWTTTYTLALTAAFANSSVTNVVTVTADVEGGPAGQTATTSQIVTVGTPLLCADPTSVLCWASMISNNLQIGLDNWWNKLLTPVSNGSYSTGVWPATSDATRYWCTYLVVDAYNLAGFSGLSKSNHAAVLNMENFWKSGEARSLGYKYLDYRGNPRSLTEVRPGYAMFAFSEPGRHTDFEHVDIIKSINIDVNGNGMITTYDTNTPWKTWVFPVDNWQIIYTLTLRPYIVTGFGGH